MDQVNARVDEIMGEGVQPMETGDDITPGNYTAAVDDMLDPSEVLRAAFNPALMQRDSA